MPELAYLNGKILPIEDALIPIEDRGYQFGDAVYEFIATYQGRMFRLDDHLNRLKRSMAELRFPAISKDRVQNAIKTLLDNAQIQRSGIYIQISRGVAPRNHAFPEAGDVQIIMTIREISERHPLWETGAGAITVKDYRWGRCDIKTVQLVPNVLAKQEALESGVYDAIFLAEDGTVREATSSNVFIITDGKIRTHPLTEKILPGITRQALLEICKEQDLPCEAVYFSEKELIHADEVFLTGTVTEVLPVIAVNNRSIGNGLPGPLTQKLYKALRQKAEK